MTTRTSSSPAGLADRGPHLVLHDLGDGRFRFELRSTVNAPLLSGGPIAGTGDLQADGRALLSLMRDETRLGVVDTPEGHCLSLAAPDGTPVGRSRPMADARLAEANLKLVRIQVARAQVVVAAR